MVRFYLLFLMVAICYTTVPAQTPTASDRSWPVPDVPGLLFYIQRDPDVNTVVYTLNTDESERIFPN